MGISINVTKDSSGRTIISANPGATTASTVVKYRFRIYAAGGTLDISIPHSISSPTVTFAIEDYAGYFITPYPYSQMGSFNIAFESYVLFGWTEREKVTGVTYPINNNEWTRPTISMSLSAVNPQGGYYMKGYSSVKAEFSSTTKLGAGVASYNLRVEGNDYGSPYISNVLTTSDKVTVTGTVTDTRGYTASVTQTIIVLANYPSVDVLSCTTRFLTGNISCKYTPINSIFYSKLVIQTDVEGILSDLSVVELGTKNGQSTYSFVISQGDLERIYLMHTNTPNVKLKFTLLSYTDSGYQNKMDQEDSEEITLAIPNDETTAPVISNIFVVPAPVLAGDADLYVKGKNGVKIIADAEAKYGAVVEVRWKCQNIEYGNEEQSSNINVTGTVVLTIVATDSRGFSTTELRQITVLDYKEPSLIVLTDRYFDKEIGFNISKANEVFCTRIKVFLGAEELQGVQPGRDDTASLTLTAENLEKIYRAFPNSSVGSVVVKMYTYSSDNYEHQYGEEKTQAVELSIPYNDDTKPKINRIDTIGYPALFETADLYVKGKNGVRASVIASAEYGATIADATYTIDNSTIASGSASGIFSGHGEFKILAWVKDSRGFTNTKEISITVLDYRRPYIAILPENSEVVVKRGNADGDIDSGGEYLYLEVGKSFSSLRGKNGCKIRFRKRVRGGEWGSYKEVLSAFSESNFFKGVIDADLDRQTIYYIEISVIDDFGAEDTYETYLTTEGVYMDRSGSRNSIAFGGHVTENNAMEVYWTAYFRNGLFFDDLANEVRYQVIIGNDGILRAVPKK